MTKTVWVLTATEFDYDSACVRVIGVYMSQAGAMAAMDSLKSWDYKTTYPTDYEVSEHLLED